MARCRPSAGRSAPLRLEARRGVGEASTLQARLRNVLGDAVAADWSRWTVRPHVTLLWTRTPTAVRALDRPQGWRVAELVLIRSLQGESRYELLARAPLTG